MKKHFVTFYSPGTFVHEETTLPIESWDVKEAVKMADGITERHGATPFAFVFTTRSRTEKDLDSKECAKSTRYYLGGRLLNLKQVKKEMPDKTILISNMEINNIMQVLVNDNSWRTCVPFEKGDVLLEYTPKKKVAA